MRWHCHNVKRSFRCWCMGALCGAECTTAMWYTMRNIYHKQAQIIRTPFGERWSSNQFRSVAFQIRAPFFPPLSPFSSFISFSGRCWPRCMGMWAWASIVCAPNEILILAIDRFIGAPSHLNVGRNVYLRFDNSESNQTTHRTPSTQQSGAITTSPPEFSLPFCFPWLPGIIGCRPIVTTAHKYNHSVSFQESHFRLKQSNNDIRNRTFILFKICNRIYDFSSAMDFSSFKHSQKK